MRPWRRPLLIGLPIVLCLGAGTGGAQQAAAEKKPAEAGTQQDQGEQKKSDDKDGRSDAGYKFSLQEQSDGWANLAGGGKRGTSYNGLTTASLDLDLEKLLEWKKARFFVSAFDIHG